MFVLAMALLQGGFGYWPWLGGMNIICAILGYLISGVLGMILGLLLGPIGLLIAFLIGNRRTA